MKQQPSQGFANKNKCYSLNKIYHRKSNFIPLICLFCLIYMICYPCLGQSKLPPIQLAKIYHPDIEITDYLVSEKLDGLRAYWDGKNLISKEGNIYQAPNWFIKTLPSQPVEGELWIGRGKFEITSSTVRKQIPIDEEWQKIKLMLFDMPSHEGDFKQRLSAMEAIVKSCECNNLQVIKQETLPNHQALMAKLNKIVKNGGEGLMLHRSNSFYQASYKNRNDDVLKLKTYQDAEAKVLGYVAGKGKFAGMMGAILVKNEEGIIFKIGSGFSLQQRINPPKIGEIITYKYFSKTKDKKPRFASFLRIRPDYNFNQKID